MGFPNYKNKHIYKPIFSPKDYLAYQRKIGKYDKFDIPDGIIFCYSKTLMDYATNAYSTSIVKNYPGDVYLLNKTGNKAGIIGNFGFGAPIVVTILEEFIALGVKRFISIGIAGTLQKNLRVGDLIVCEKAIRDEGTSYHYLKPSKYAYASKELTSSIKKALDMRGRKYSVGTSWTTDAPYRETFTETRKYQEEGVMTVEMEASALFAVAQYRGVHMGAVFTVSDSIAEFQWSPKFHFKKIRDSMEVLFQASIEVLQR